MQRPILILTLLLIAACNTCEAQTRMQPTPEPELALGVKAVIGLIIYGRNEWFVTGSSSIGIQPVLRYDKPLTVGDDKYLVLVGQAGFLFCKARAFDTLYRNPVTNAFVWERSRNPNYLPLYAGVYNRSRLSVGAELFYWKGLGTRDIWGAKFLSLGYNGKGTRINVAGEYYSQPRKGSNDGFLLSIDLFIKLIRGA